MLGKERALNRNAASKKGNVGDVERRLHGWRNKKDSVTTKCSTFSTREYNTACTNGETDSLECSSTFDWEETRAHGGELTGLSGDGSKCEGGENINILPQAIGMVNWCPRLSFLLRIVLCESCALSCTFPLNSVVCTPCYLLTFTFYISSSHSRSSNNGTLAFLNETVEC